jgi:uncharacterized protein YkwD
MGNRKRLTGKRAFWMSLVVCMVLLVVGAIPVTVYIVVTRNRSLNNSANIQAPSEYSTIPTTGSESQTRTPSTISITSSTPTTSNIASTTSTSSSVGSTVPTQDLDDLQQQMLIRHNQLRSLHGAPNMTWNSELTQFAVDYAASNFSCDNVQLIHSGGPYGENLAAGYVGAYDPLNAWYNEIDLYDYQNPGFTEETGHFTQLIWDDTVELGCAIVLCNNAWRQYTICEYYPAGNIVGSTNALTQESFREHVNELLS